MWEACQEKCEKYISIHFGAEVSRQPVPVARHRLDQAAGGQRAQLPAQLKDRVFHGVQAAVGGFAPDGLIDGFFGQDLAGRAAEEPQHLKFLGGEAELLPIQGGVMPGLFQPHDGLPPDAHQSRQLLLSQAHALAET